VGWKGEGNFITRRFDPLTVQSLASHYTDCAVNMETRKSIHLGHSGTDGSKILTFFEEKIGYNDG
jgi:hypothetical protein